MLEQFIQQRDRAESRVLLYCFSRKKDGSACRWTQMDGTFFRPSPSLHATHQPSTCRCPSMLIDDAHNCASVPIAVLSICAMRIDAHRCPSMGIDGHRWASMAIDVNPSTAHERRTKLSYVRSKAIGSVNSYSTFSEHDTCHTDIDR